MNKIEETTSASFVIECKTNKPSTKGLYSLGGKLKKLLMEDMGDLVANGLHKYEEGTINFRVVWNKESTND